MLKKEKANYYIVKKNNAVTTTWSGGTTTELFIYPKESDYTKRDFLIRVSTATVDTFESSFTSLPGFKRYIMPLSGSLTLNHNGHYKTTLKPYNVDNFLGEWDTTSFGKCIDFNLIINERYTGNITALKGVIRKDINLNQFNLFYSPHSKSEIEIITKNEQPIKEILEKDDIMIFENNKNFTKDQCQLQIKSEVCIYINAHNII